MQAVCVCVCDRYVLFCTVVRRHGVQENYAAIDGLGVALMVTVALLAGLIVNNLLVSCSYLASFFCAFRFVSCRTLLCAMHFARSECQQPDKFAALSTAKPTTTTRVPTVTP